nr:MAG: hypothetical protein [uncultured archaeon]BDI55243.1 MAG: hypothetical protein [uncultured archaeon]
MVNNRIKDSELYKEIKAIFDELLKGLSDKIAYLVCALEEATREQTQPEKVEEKSFLARIKYEQKEQLKDFCRENNIGCDWFVQRKTWKLYSDKEQLLTKARDFVLNQLKGKIF